MPYYSRLHAGKEDEDRSKTLFGGSICVIVKIWVYIIGIELFFKMFSFEDNRSVLSAFNGVEDKIPL